MPGFSMQPNDPREPEWAERIVDAFSSVIIEAAPSADALTSVYRTLDAGGEDTVRNVMSTATLHQFTHLVPQITERVIEHLKGLRQPA